MQDAAAVRLRPAGRSDWDLIRGWLARDDIQDWWGPLSATEAELNIALGSAHAICRIIEAGAEPVGYAHAVDATLWGELLPQDLEAGTWDLDLFIASEEHRGRGVGQAALALLKEEVFASTLAVAGVRLPLCPQRARGTRLREGRLPLEAHLERPAFRAVLVHGGRAPRR